MKKSKFENKNVEDNGPYFEVLMPKMLHGIEENQESF
jgi:hypothetical protein